jgi:hypothetical protein
VNNSPTYLAKVYQAAKARGAFPQNDFEEMLAALQK